MGRVKVDIYKSEYEFRNVTLSDPATVLALILMRHKVDKYYDFGYKSAILDAENWNDVNQELICLYVDLDLLIEECGLSQDDKQIIQFYEMGFSKQDISDMTGDSTKSVATKIRNIAKQICELNFEKWRLWLYLNYIKTEWKQCRICGKSYPLNERFFRSREDTNDGYRNECISCHNTMVNTK
jgi:hypothetical protein